MVLAAFAAKPSTVRNDHGQSARNLRRDHWHCHLARHHLHHVSNLRGRTVFYVPVTITVCKDDVCLFETDCEARIDYEIVDDLPDWDVTEFHFDACGTEPGKRIYTKVARHMPLFHILYDAVDREWLHEQVMEAVINNGEISRYA
jgi:hypothetical protein